MNYLDRNVALEAYISYREVMPDGRFVHVNEHVPCFYSMFQGGIQEGAVRFEFPHPRINIPYSNESIVRWIANLNEMGFPCSVEIGETCIFKLELKDYKWKLHVMSTLMLLRLLTESGLVKMPELFFQKLDEDPTQDKFKLLQWVHKGAGLKYINRNHMVTHNGASRYDNSGAPNPDVTREELEENFEASGLGVYHSGRGDRDYRAVNDAWWGNYKPKETVTISP